MAGSSGMLPPLGSVMYQRADSAGGSRPSSAASSVRSAVRKHKAVRPRASSHDPRISLSRNKRPSTVMSLPLASPDSEISSRYSLRHSARSHRPLGSALCIKCMLNVVHKRCEAHKYIRVGGGFRHSYSYLKSVFEQMQAEMKFDGLNPSGLDAIHEAYQLATKTTREMRLSTDSALGSSAASPQPDAEGHFSSRQSSLVGSLTAANENGSQARPNSSVLTSGFTPTSSLGRYSRLASIGAAKASYDGAVKAVKTYIRTKSGNLVERIVFMSEEDYQKFMEGGADAAEMIKKYLSKDEAQNLESWDKEESPKDEEEEEVKAIKTYIRTKSGRLVEKLVYVSKSDYDKIKSGEMDSEAVLEVLKKYVKPEDGEKLDGWGEAEMKMVKTMVRTKSGRLIEKTIMVSKEEYEELQRIAREGGDPTSVLKKYMSKDEKVESWKKVEQPPKPMKVVKTMVRTKSGRLVEKTIMMTEEEYKAFQESGGDKNFLKKFMKLEDGEEVEAWEKASTVYGADSDDEQVKKAKVGQRIVGADGVVYEIVVDPVTGKKFKKKVGVAKDMKNLDEVLKGGKAKFKKGKGPRKGKGGGSDSDDLPTAEEIKKYKAMKEGKRNKDSDSDFSYRSVVSAGGTRKVLRRRKRADGTYSAEHSYHSEDDEEGKARRRRRRRERRHGADSAHSYYSVVSAGGTRRVRRRRRNADGTYGTDEEYHSDESIAMRRAMKKKKKKQRHGSDSEHSYFSEVSAGGTRRKKRRKRIRDADGKIIGYGSDKSYSSPEDSDSSYESYYDSDGVKRYRQKPKKVKHGKAGGKKGKLGKSRKDFDGGFSDMSTDTEDEPDLEAMTEEERREYLAKKEQRRAERERRRREKYGDKYDEIMAKHEKNKKQLRKERALAEGLGWDSDEYDKDPEAFKEKYKSMVTYDKGGKRFKDGKSDNRGPGMGHESWGDGKKGKKTVRVKDGHEADSEGDDDDGTGRGRKKKKGGKGGYAAGIESETESFIGSDGKRKKRTKKGGEEIIESDFEYEYEYDEQGRIKRKKKKYHDGESGSEYEFEYDQFGNLIGKKKIKEGNEKKKHRIFKEDDGNYFEKGPDGKMRLRPGRTKIDIDKLTADDLRALGIDPNMSKQDIARALKAKFGDSLTITKGGQKVGLKSLADYGSDANTDDLANDSDLDTSTLKPGRRRVQILMKKGGSKLLEYMKKMIDDSLLGDKLDPERDASIDYIQTYKLVDQRKIDVYAKAFVVEDENKTGILKYEDVCVALEAIPSINSITKKQVKYVMKVLNLDEHADITFRMFGVSVALCERVTKMDSYCKELLEICNLADIERKIALYRAMFECNASGDRDSNYIKCESLMIELMAGGLNWEQQQYVMSQLVPNEWKEISFIDYLVYIPLFLSMHDGICDNPLDMSLNKYRTGHRVTEQRDMNPLGYSLKKNTAFLLRQQAEDLLSGKKPDVEQAKKDNAEVINRYSKLPSIIGSVEKRPAGASRFM